MAKIKPVRVVKTSYGTYSLHYTNTDGRRRRLSVGSDLQVAESIRIKFIDWLLECKDPEREMEHAKQEENARSITLRDYFPDYFKRHGAFQSRNMQDLYRHRFAQICRCMELVDCPLADINKRLVIDYMQARLNQDGVSPATVNREVSVIRGLLSKAVEWDILPRNPLQGIKLLKEAEKRDVTLTREQAGDLIDVLPERVGAIVEFAIYTGLRKQNILGLRIEDVTFLDVTPTAEVSLTLKGGNQKSKLLGQAATEVLRRETGDRKSGYVFQNPDGGRYKDVKDTFNRAVRKLGLTAVNGSKLRFHDLRHVFASWLGNAGVSLDDLRVLLDHKHRDTTDRYLTRDRNAVGDKLALLLKIDRKRA